MSPQFLFHIIISIILLDFVIDKFIDHLNAKHFNDAIPDELFGQMKLKVFWKIPMS